MTVEINEQLSPLLVGRDPLNVGAQVINVPTRVVDKSSVDGPEVYISWALNPPRTY